MILKNIWRMQVQCGFPEHFCSEININPMIRRKKSGDNMENPIKKKTPPLKPQTIVQHIQVISDASDKIGSIEALLLEVPESIKIVSEYLKCSEIQATLFSLIFTMNFVRCSVDLEDISTVMKCNPLNIGARINDFDELINLRLIRKEPVDGSRHRSLFPQAWKYHILPELFEPILHGEELGHKESRFNSLFALLKTIYDIINNRENDIYTFKEMEREIQSIMGDNGHLPFVKQVNTLELDSESLYMLLYICSGFIQNEETVNLPSMLKSIFPDIEDHIRIRRNLIHGQHELQKKELITLEESVFRIDREVTLTEKCIDALFSDDKNLITQKDEKKKPDIINFHDIPEKQLFFGINERDRLGFLEEILQPGNFKKLSLRMEEKKMPTGVAILLYGAPGTGKTESVYQLARRTGRDIHQVVISDTKSKWFGDSEKLIKKVFDKYRNVVAIKEVAPILLFNEADGIFSKRKETHQSSVDQTENAIQNIILQEMEDLKGILIATTNMAGNLDKAFERRFLYKICFEKPTPEARFQIWKDKIPSLTIDELTCLAEEFNLSGGQIDNIARKCIMKEVLHDVAPNMNELLSYCSEENLHTSIQRIGFLR